MEQNEKWNNFYYKNFSKVLRFEPGTFPFAEFKRVQFQSLFGTWWKVEHCGFMISFQISSRFLSFESSINHLIQPKRSWFLSTFPNRRKWHNRDQKSFYPFARQHTKYFRFTLVTYRFISFLFSSACLKLYIFRMSSAQKRFLDQNKQHINLSQSGGFFRSVFRVRKEWKSNFFISVAFQHSAHLLNSNVKVSGGEEKESRGIWCSSRTFYRLSWN